jgi:surface antigen
MVVLFVDIVLVAAAGARAVRSLSNTGTNIRLASAFSETPSNLGYPYSQAPCEYTAGGSSCKNPKDPANQNDWYEWGEYNSQGVFQIYRNGYEYRNCTDYVQWKEDSLGASVPGNLGNGGQWYNNVPSSERSSSPQAWGAAVQPPSAANSAGHVAFVESVNTNGTITVSEYNFNGTGAGDIRTGSAASMGFTEFVNFGAHPTTSVSGGSTSSASTSASASTSMNASSSNESSSTPNASSSHLFQFYVVNGKWTAFDVSKATGTSITDDPATSSGNVWAVD